MSRTVDVSHRDSHAQEGAGHERIRRWRMKPFRLTLRAVPIPEEPEREPLRLIGSVAEPERSAADRLQALEAG
jgi:hypothetical protein